MEVKSMLRMCKCERDDYAIDEIHYARCIRCMGNIDSSVVEQDWEKRYSPLRKPLEEEE